MKTGFETLEERMNNSDNAVFGTFEENEVFGTITLARKDSLIDLICEKSVGKKKTEEGWFGLTLVNDNGKSIHLHRAFNRQPTQYFYKNEKCRQQIYANAILFGAEKLAEGNLVKRIFFYLERGDDFFAYRRLEKHYVDNLKGATLSLLDRMRKQQNRRNARYKIPPYERYDLTDPHELLFQHEEKGSMSFKVGRNKYEVYTSSRRQKGMGDNIHIKYDPSFSITFSKLVSIEEALDAASNWQRVFHQIALRRLAVTATAMSGFEDLGEGYSDVYLPHELPEKTGLELFSTAYVPYCRYDQRDQWVKFIKKWLSLDKTHNRFRTLLDDCMHSENTATSISKIASLCGGIETLPIKPTAPIISKADIKALAKTAHNKSKRLKLPFSHERISGLIHQLRKPGLKGFLKHMVSEATDLSNEDAEVFIKQVIRLRQVASHGKSGESLHQPIAHHVRDALRCLCILYDFKCSGMSKRAMKENRILALESFRQSVLTVVAMNAGNWVA